MATVNCPTCKRPTEFATSNPWRPFCSERCKLIDLGDWASEKNAIACAEESPNSESLDSSTPRP